MREGNPDEEDDSGAVEEEITSVHDLPKEVMAEMERESFTNVEITQTR